MKIDRNSGDSDLADIDPTLHFWSISDLIEVYIFHFPGLGGGCGGGGPRSYDDVICWNEPRNPGQPWPVRNPLELPICLLKN